ncbi:hypothetical protein [Streptomyces sp. DSM 40750]
MTQRAGDGPEEGYLLNNQQSEAGERFHAPAAFFDAATFRHIRPRRRP